MNQTSVILGATLFMALTGPAYAYLDPGTGSILLQGLFALIAGTIVTVKMYWHKVQAFFHKNRSNDSKTPETD